ncbi:type III pantothenate kinase [Pseudofulvibacter geojedonensis]|uniref:Type III pantothenate kinase n=1 Tax=Pseudofulvibacter geojedonensis TaxID=1123758 RepID=A0ABW3I392_9FLAO
MHLIIDVGNTRAKLAVYENNSLKKRWVVEKKNLLNKSLKILKNDPDISHAIISSVAHLDEKGLNEIDKKAKLLVLNKDVAIPFKNLYATPKTLGVDRIALIAAAAHQYPGKNILVVDAGTCVTFDFLNSNNEYLGGAISPGLTIRYEALHKLTAKLPLLKPEQIEDFIGDSTATSMHSGVVNGLVQEIDGVITQYKNRYKELTVILTGGDTNFLAKSLKSSIFANSNFLLEGLNVILEINKD